MKDIMLESHVFNVRKFGASGDGTSRDDSAFQRAIDQCRQSGGGAVVVPPGDYLCATIELRSNVNLHLMPGATMRASDEQSDYADRKLDCLIFADGAENISITGRGVLHGQGEADERPAFRVRMVRLENCRNIHIEGVTFLYASQWTIHLLRCDTAMLRGISILNNPRRLNTDGIDPDCSRNIHISDCRIVAGDDCIVVKTTQPEPCSDIVVSNCALETTCAALKVGTETHGKISNILFSNCVVRNTRAALALYVKDGATVENISFDNISVETNGGGEFPLFATIEQRFPDSSVGALRNVSFSNLFIRTRGRCILHGHPESPIENLSMSNVAISVHEPEDAARRKPPRGANRVSRDTAVVEHPKAPAALVFGRIKGLTLNDVAVDWADDAQAEERHAIFAANVDGMSLRGFRGRQAKPDGKLAAVRLKNSPNAMITGCRAPEKTGCFIEADAKSKRGMISDSNHLENAREKGEG